MAIISLGKINKKILFPIIGGIFKLSAELATKGLSDVYEIELEKHPFILGINAGLGFCLSFIPYLIFKKNYDYLDKKHFEENEKKQLIFNEDDDIYLEKSYNKHRLLYIIGFCDFIQKFLAFLYIGLYNFWIFDIPFMMLFSYFILKEKLYKHHFVSLILIIFFGIVIIVIYYLFSNTDNELFFKILNTLVIEIIFSLEIVIAKYAIEYKFCSPYEICLMEGIVILIINLLLLILFTFVPLSEINYIKYIEYDGKIYLDNFIQYFSQISYIEAILFIIIMLSRFGFNIFCLLTTKYFTPSHIIIILIIGEVYFALKDLVFSWKKFVLSGLYIILIFVLLVFLEIIEINCYGFQKNTEKNISIRAKEIDLTLIEDELEEEKEEE